MSRRAWWLGAWILVVVVAGCDGPPPADEDAGRDGAVDPDAGPVDAAMPDGAMPDGSMPECGNGVVEGDEECDEGENNSDTAPDACRTDCTLPRCGDGVIDGGETCDGTELGGRTCADEGFASGTLRCAADCGSFDTSSCSEEPGPTCGDGVREGTEACDGADLGTATCASEGFDGGTLACTGTCELDTTGCFSCGDGVKNGGEECDGSDLGGSSCTDFGFDGGALSCGASCTYDTSACFRCGDGVKNGGEECDGSDLGGASCTGLGFDGGTLTCSASCTLVTAMCTDCGNGVAEGAEECDGTDLRGATCASRPGFASGPLACSASCTYDESACSTAASPSAAGDIVITEIMQNPGALNDADGEWFEVHNPGAAPLNLFGCLVRGNAATGDRFAIDANVVVPPGGYATFAVDSSVPDAPGFVPDYRWSSSAFSLANGSDAVVIECGGTIIDAVAYDDGATFPDPNGRSMSLDPAYLDATANDDGAHWCEATTTYATGDRGTPGAPNDACPRPFAIDFCRLQFPTDLTAGVEIGSTTTVYGRYHAAGITDDPSGTTVTPPPELLRAQLGYGPDGSDPATATGWVWTNAVPNTSYGPGVPGHEHDNDEYQADLVAPSPAGTYDFAYRFSGDGGATWVYCDGGAGSADGYSPSDAGQLVTVPPTVTANLYFSEYIEGSSNNKAVEIYNAGTADVSLDGCAVQLFSNGASSPGTTIALMGTLVPGGVYTVCHSMIDTGHSMWPSGYACDRSHGGLTFNGDDAVALVCSGVTLDVIGQIGFDPGNAWTGGGLSTLDQTLRRMCTVTAGDPDGSDAFDPSAEWEGFATDDMSGLGSRGCP